MRLVLCIVLFACSCALGFVAADRLRQRCKAIEALQGILDTLSVRRRYYQEPLSQAVQRTAQSTEGNAREFLSMLAQQLGKGYSAAEALKGALTEKTQAITFQESLGKEEKQSLEELFERIGSHREDQEDSLCIMCAKADAADGGCAAGMAEKRALVPHDGRAGRRRMADFIFIKGGDWIECRFNISYRCNWDRGSGVEPATEQIRTG